MAKLGSYYGLCPLIDQRNLLGIAEDTKPGHVIVTLGKNIAIKYRISDQKQIHSWRTKDKFSSPVVYDEETNEYVAVFNHIFMRKWNGDEEYVDKLKKYKFNKPIHTLVTCNKKTFLIFKNGTVMPLSYGIEKRKEITLDNIPNINTDVPFEVLTASLNNQFYIAVMFYLKEKAVVALKVFNEDQERFNIIELVRDNRNITLKGQILCQIENREDMRLFALWSDGKLYSYQINNESEGELNPVSKENLFGTFEFLSCKDHITMAYLNQHYIAMYGADCNEEGAALILYNTQFKVSQSKQLLKLFTSGAKLWKIENNLLFCSGHSLGVMPFYLDREQLSALVGSHRVALIELDPEVVVVEELEEVTWSAADNGNVDRLIPSNIANQVLELSQQGLAESTICEALFPGFIENKNVKAISSCLNYFCDVPEMYLVESLSFCLTADSKYFSNTRLLDSSSLPLNLRQIERCQLIDKILMSSFSDSLLLPCVHSKLDLNSTILLLQYIFYLMSEEGHKLNSTTITDSIHKLIDWCCVLLDANYQKFLLSKDSQIIEILTNFSDLVLRYSTSLENLRQTVPLLSELKKGKKVMKNKQISNLQYSIEQLNLY